MSLTLPSRRDEAWRWADLDALQAARSAPATPVPTPPFLDLDGARLVFVDGVFDVAASDTRGVVVEPIAPVTEHPLGKHTAGTGWSLTLGPQQAETCVQIVHVGTGGESHVPGRIILAADAVASIVETYVGTGWANRLTTIGLAEGARLMRSVRILQSAGFVSLREEATIGKAASLVSVFLGAGGMASRVDGTLRVVGDGGFAEMGGALLTRGEQRQECAVTVRHEALHGTSNQTWRAVAADRSAASLAARVDVARGAQKTDGVQSLRGLLLDRTATINLKPELEIFADDVKCAHGATVGELDRNAMFYLQSRGIPLLRARALMTRAFVADAIDRIGEDAVRDAFAADADAWLEGAA
ncbi:SufD family Fe-S cluster assembly protein [Sphingomonas sp. S1-29]|uniref:SufB/SufD family protein n=1 Tax=Sphingomonas sp. S1-29 TaxID=2991074 RepID=UPI00223ED4D2|nr:SufD family Fe-S cluster assembly protein [Sphingomonas sp. S1-29]UZK69162.1 SufD family Fe-S cluster assembly protein [Sphingomonas sp. S1-29]